MRANRIGSLRFWHDEGPQFKLSWEQSYRYLANYELPHVNTYPTLAFDVTTQCDLPHEYVFKSGE